jgi:hypothetical protein
MCSENITRHRTQTLRTCTVPEHTKVELALSKSPDPSQSKAKPEAAVLAKKPLLHVGVQASPVVSPSTHEL